MKKIAAAGALAAAVGGFLLTAAPAHADDDDNWPGRAFWKGPENFQVIPIETCRGIDVAGIGAAVHNALGVDNEEGPCVNGPVALH